MTILHLRYKDRTGVHGRPAAQRAPRPASWVMAYDTRPLLTLKEKAAFLTALWDERAGALRARPDHECATLQRTEKGVRLDRTLAGDRG